MAILNNIFSHIFIHSFASEMLGHFIEEIKMLKLFQYLCSLLLFSLKAFFFFNFLNFNSAPVCAAVGKTQ